MSRKNFKGEITASIAAWAKVAGVQHSQFTVMLKRADIDYTPGQDLSAESAFAACTFRSEKDEAIARQANAKAEEQEMINAERRKELMELAQIEKVIWGDLLQPLRTEMDQMPKSLCGLCNPQEPEVAEAVLQNWVEKTKLNIKEK
jgi:hypothetical protein